MELKYPVYKERMCIALTEEEDKILGENLSKLSFADLKALLEYSIIKQEYHQRRFQNDLKPENINYHLHEEQYSGWLWWFHITIYTQYTIDKYINNLCQI